MFLRLFNCLYVYFWFLPIYRYVTAVNYYHKALHLGCCSSPRSASEAIGPNRREACENSLLLIFVSLNFRGLYYLSVAK